MEKLFYTIGEVADMFGVNPSLIRFWEKEFEVIKPQRNKKGNRLFTRRDIDYFHQIYHLVKEQGYTLQGTRERLKDKPLDEKQANMQMRESLLKIKNFLLELKEIC
ncbi:MAG: MerR family transcriptional regulator [Bacteroidales bacterium]